MAAQKKESYSRLRTVLAVALVIGVGILLVFAMLNPELAVLFFALLPVGWLASRFLDLEVK